MRRIARYLTAFALLLACAVSWAAFPVGWSYYEVVTIPATEAVTDFPVLIANLPSEVFAHANADGSDVRFTVADGSVELPVEIVSWNNGAETAEIWVNVPSLSAVSTTDVRVYYGNSGASLPAADSTYGSQNVWPAEAKGVYHLGEAVNNDAGGYHDSTANGNDMTGTSMSIAASAGPTGMTGAQNFDGSADYLSIASALVTSAPVTFSCWHYKDVQDPTIRYSIRVTSGSQWYAMQNWNAILYAKVKDAAGQHQSTVTEGYGAWHYAANRYPSTTSRFAITDATVGTENTDEHDPSGLTTTLLGESWDGAIDEVRIYSADMGADWLLAEYEVVHNEASVTYGSEQSIGGAPAPTYRRSGSVGMLFAKFIGRSGRPVTGCSLFDNWIVPERNGSLTLCWVHMGDN